MWRGGQGRKAQLARLLPGLDVQPLVIGLYGVLYLDVARRPEHGGLVAAVGLAGKVLGPAGLALAVGQGRWPARAFLVTAGNDFPWWWPFTRYLRDLAAIGFTPANSPPHRPPTSP